MVKKKYIHPIMKTVELHSRTALQSGSPNIWPDEDTAPFSDEYEDDDYFI